MLSSMAEDNFHLKMNHCTLGPPSSDAGGEWKVFGVPIALLMLNTGRWDRAADKSEDLPLVAPLGNNHGGHRQCRIAPGSHRGG